MRRAVALIVLALAGTAASADELGRLFFTPAEREALDARRKAGVPDKPPVSSAPSSPVTRLDGYVRRSGGPTTVWVNGTALDDSPRPVVDPRRGHSVPRIPVPVGSSGTKVNLKPGEALDRGTGEVTDVIGPDGQIRVQRRVPGRP